jgi:hypothetical protein
MSTESMPHVNSETESLNQDTQSHEVVTPSAEAVRDQVHPERKKSFAEKHLDTRFKKWGAGVLIAASALSVGGVGYSMAQSKSVEAQQPNNQEKEFNPLAVPYNFVDSKQYKELDVDQQMDMGKLNLMSAAEFAALPLETQFKFNTLQLDRYEPWALKVAKEAKPSNKQLPIDNPPTITLQSSGQDIVNDSAVKRCVQWFSLTKQSQGSPGALAPVGDADRMTAAKMDSLRAVVGNWYYNEDQKELTSGTAFNVSDLCAPDVIVDKESPVVTIDGNQTKVVQGFNTESKKTIQQVYIYSELTDYKGEKRPNWLLSDTGDKTGSKVWYADPSTLK